MFLVSTKPSPIRRDFNAEAGWTAVSKEEPAIPPELVQYRQDRTSDNNKCGAIGVAYSSGIRPNLARRGSLGPHFPPSLPPTAVYGASAHKRKPKDENAGRCEARLQPQRPMKVDYVGSSKCRNAPGNCVENVTLPKLLEAGHRRITTTVIGNKVPTLKPPCDQCKALLGAFGDKYGAVFVDGATGERYMGRKQRAFTSCVESITTFDNTVLISYFCVQVTSRLYGFMCHPFAFSSWERWFVLTARYIPSHGMPSRAGATSRSVRSSGRQVLACCTVLICKSI